MVGGGARWPRGRGRKSAGIHRAEPSTARQHVVAMLSPLLDFVVRSRAAGGLPAALSGPKLSLIHI